MFKNAFWERSKYRMLLSLASRQDVFEKEVGEPAVFYSALSTVQSACEIGTLYPSDVELKRNVIEAWNILSDANLLGSIVWELRARELLGII